MVLNCVLTAALKQMVLMILSRNAGEKSRLLQSDVLDNTGKTALYKSCSLGLTNVAKTLIECGVCVNTAASCGKHHYIRHAERVTRR